MKLDTNVPLARLTRETAVALGKAVAAQQPVSLKLITKCVMEHLRDEQAVAELVIRSMCGENAFRHLVKDIVHAEAEQIAHATLAATVEQEAA